jgi:hypothetical protein
MIQSADIAEEFSLSVEGRVFSLGVQFQTPRVAY